MIGSRGAKPTRSEAPTKDGTPHAVGSAAQRRAWHTPSNLERVSQCFLRVRRRWARGGERELCTTNTRAGSNLGGRQRPLRGTHCRPGLGMFSYKSSLRGDLQGSRRGMMLSACNAHGGSRVGMTRTPVARARINQHRHFVRHAAAPGARTRRVGGHGVRVAAGKEVTESTEGSDGGTGGKDDDAARSTDEGEDKRGMLYIDQEDAKVILGTLAVSLLVRTHVQPTCAGRPPHQAGLSGPHPFVEQGACVYPLPHALSAQSPHVNCDDRCARLLPSHGSSRRSVCTPPSTLATG
jgi:hypothetical protein